MNTVLEDLHVVTDDGSSDTSMALNVHEVTDSNDDLLNLLSELTRRGQNQCLTLLEVEINLLEDGNGESGSLSGS